ncbi:MAG: hypothetical protein R3264_10515, partial [Anaerolineae bacterium]|nr:hypothetical protein [Anaerolineae bacterium]
MIQRKPFISYVLILIILGLGACNQTEAPVAAADTQAEPQAQAVALEAAGVTVEATLVPTFTPTVPPRTPTPTKGPPTPTATLVLTATPTPVIHVVEQFDTLLQLSVDYDVPYSALLAVNNLNED